MDSDPRQVIHRPLSYAKSPEERVVDSNNSLKRLLRRTAVLASGSLMSLILLMGSGIQWLGGKFPVDFVQEAHGDGDGDTRPSSAGMSLGF